MSDPTTDHAARLRELIDQFIPDGFVDEDGVPHDGPLRAEALAALGTLEAERDEWKRRVETLCVSANAEMYHAHDEGVRRVRAEIALREARQSLLAIKHLPRPTIRNAELLAHNAIKRIDAALAVSSASKAETEEAVDPNICGNCGHSRELHFRANAYVPGKCDFQYDLCGCRNFVPAFREEKTNGKAQG